MSSKSMNNNLFEKKILKHISYKKEIHPILRTVGHLLHRQPRKWCPEKFNLENTFPAMISPPPTHSSP